MLQCLQDTVSVHRPGFYAQRFQDFMAKTVFKKIPSRKYYFQSFICSKLSEVAMGALTLHVCAPVIFITAAVTLSLKSLWYHLLPIVM
jgi:hypothetical protein